MVTQFSFFTDTLVKDTAMLDETFAMSGKHNILLVHTEFWPEHPKRQNSCECLFTDMWMILKHLSDIRSVNMD